jgi:hypothetical protein
MLATAPQTEAVWSLLEESYLEEADAKSGTYYHGLSDEEKRAALKAFAKEQSVKSKRWIEISGTVQAL